MPKNKNLLFSVILVLGFSIAHSYSSFGILNAERIKALVNISETQKMYKESRTDNPDYGANCAGAVLLGLGLLDTPKFIELEVMQNQIIPNCFIAVESPEKGDIGAVLIGDSFIHFNLFLDSKISFNKWDIGANYEIVEHAKSGSCISENGIVNKWCKYFSYNTAPACSELILKRLIK